MKITWQQHHRCVLHIWHKIYKMLSYRRENALQGALVLAKSGRLELGGSILRTLWSIFNYWLWHNRPSKQSNSVKKTQNRGYRAVEGHSRSVLIENPVCNFLLVINSNWHPISNRFGVIAAYCSNFGHFAFLAPYEGLGTTYDVHLGPFGKRVVDFLLELIELICYVLRLRCCGRK